MFIESDPFVCVFNVFSCCDFALVWSVECWSNTNSQRSSGRTEYRPGTRNTEACSGVCAHVLYTLTSDD